MKKKQVNTEFVESNSVVKKKKTFFLRWWFILIAIIVVGVIALGTDSDAEKIIWEDVVLGDALPEPSENKGVIHTNSADALWIDINELSDKQFNDYVEACKEEGFTIDAKSGTDSYDAFNAKGYKLSLGHYGSDADMSIRLEAPMKMTTITWPTSAAGKQVPAPKSKNGSFSYEHEDSFYVYVGDTTKAEYNDYVNSCSENGFNIDYSKSEDYYSANNSEGWQVAIRYEGNNIMSISISMSDDELTYDDESETVATENDNSENEGLSSDFKAAMDSYEAFISDYVDFMKKYNANPNDITLIGDYAKYVSDYAELAEDFEKWDDEEMNAAEVAYYLEVQNEPSVLPAPEKGLQQALPRKKPGSGYGSLTGLPP